MSERKIVQILRSSKPTYWYHNRIGESFLVEDGLDKWIVIPNNGRTITKADTREKGPKPKRMLRLA